MQADREKILKASTALLKHIKTGIGKKDAESSTRNLLANDSGSSNDTSADAEPVWLVLTTKKHIADQRRLKPGKIHLPHSFNASSSTTICLITADPQRQFKDAITHPSFSPALSSRIRVIGVSKLKARYKSFESRRQLLSEYDVFLADDRVITMLPKALGKVFYTGSKRPIPVHLEAHKRKDASGKRVKPSTEAKTKSIASPVQLAKEIERTLSCTQVHISPSVTTAVRVGLSNFSADHVSENIEAVVTGMIEKFITKGWRNIRAIHIKGPNTAALPLWLASEIWVAEEDILENEEAKEALQLASQKGRKRKVREGEDEGDTQKKKAKKMLDSDLTKEMAERREKLRQQKKEAKEEVQGKITTAKTDGTYVKRERVRLRKPKTIVEPV